VVALPVGLIGGEKGQALIGAEKARLEGEEASSV
jgi:hypothetical protein